MARMDTGRTMHLAGKAGLTKCGEMLYGDTLAASVRGTTCYYCRMVWDAEFESEIRASAAENCEGLSLGEWLVAAGCPYVTDASLRRAWLNGEDPTEYRAMLKGAA